jgi:hypothetical protein
MNALITPSVALFTICSTASCSKDERTPNENIVNGTNNASATKMKITIGTAVFAATLYDNPSAIAVYDAVQVNRSFTIPIDRPVIRRPPGWHGELKDEHFLVFINIKSFQTTIQYEIFRLYLIAFTDNGLPFFE